MSICYILAEELFKGTLTPEFQILKTRKLMEVRNAPQKRIVYKRQKL